MTLLTALLAYISSDAERFARLNHLDERYPGVYNQGTYYAVGTLCAILALGSYLWAGEMGRYLYMSAFFNVCHFLVLYIYFWIVVYSFFKELQDEERIIKLQEEIKAV